MSTSQGSLFGGRRIQMDESIQLTVDSLNLYGPRHADWAIAWSGGKDSTTLLTLAIHLLESGRVERPKTLTVLYADTRLELLPLWLAANAIREELNARTGCVGCPLATQDTALDALVANPMWSYLAPLKELRPLWRELREPAVRKRKRGVERRKDGSIGTNPQRMGPITLEARAEALERVLDIQRRVNAVASSRGRPLVDLLNAEEEARIRELLAARTWPQKWSDDDADADEVLEQINGDGTVQALLPMFEGEDDPS